MAGYAPAPLPSISLVSTDTFTGGSGGAAFLPHVGLLFSANTPVISAATGAFAVAGSVAQLAAGHHLIAVVGTFAETGIAAAFLKSTIGVGSGAPASLPSLGLLLATDPNHPFLIAGTGTFAVAGAPPALTWGHVNHAATGVFLFTGAPSQSDDQVDASAGSFALTGAAATLARASPGVTAVPGTFALAGTDTALNYQKPGVKTLIGQAGAFSLVGNAATFPPRNHVIQAIPGAFLMTAQTATIIGVHWARVDPASAVWTPVAPSSAIWTHP